MPTGFHPIIDVAVHEQIRQRLAEGKALAVLSDTLSETLWANSAGADLFGFGSAGEFVASGLSSDATLLRQIRSAAGRLGAPGEARGFIMRIAQRFRMVAVAATAERISFEDGTDAVLIVADARHAPRDDTARAEAIVHGLSREGDEIAIVDSAGSILAATAGFYSVGLSGEDLGAMANFGTNGAARQRIDTNGRNLPVVFGRLSNEPDFTIVQAFWNDEIAERAGFPSSAFIAASAGLAAAGLATGLADDNLDWVDETLDFTGDASQPNADELSASETDWSALEQPEPDADHTHEVQSNDLPETADFNDGQTLPDPVGYEAGTPEAVQDAAPEQAEGAYDAGWQQDNSVADEGPQEPADTDETANEQTFESAPQPAISNVNAWSLDPNPASDDAGQAPEQMADDTPMEDSGSYDFQPDGMAQDEEPDAGQDISPWNNDEPQFQPLTDEQSGEERSVSEDTTHQDDAPQHGDEFETFTELHNQEPEAHEPLWAAEPPAETAPEPVIAEAESAPNFVFDPTAKSARFVWKADASGRITEISENFSAAVGPHAADIRGQDFAMLSDWLGIDPEGVIARLLAQRDTWSGKTVHWPVEGTNLVVPVDLAALPTYTREREFDGFRGFGVIRSREAFTDPRAIGVTLAATRQSGGQFHGAGDETQGDGHDGSGDDEPAPGVFLPEADQQDFGQQETGQQDFGPTDPVTSEMTDDSRDAPDGVEAGSPIFPPADNGNTPAGQDGEWIDEDQGFSAAPDPFEGEDENIFHSDDDGPSPDTDDGFGGEQPVLSIAETPARRLSDKVIQLEERRARGRDGLSSGEQAAFREIGEKLGSTFGRREQPPAVDETGNDDQTGSGEVSAENDVDDTSVSMSGEPVAEHDGDDTTDAHAEDATDNDDHEVMGDSGDDDASDEAPEPEFAPQMPSAFALPDGGRARHAFNEAIVDQIPVPLLVHVGDRLHHANVEFLQFTGYPSTIALEEAGGIEALFDTERVDGDTSAVTVLTRSGERRPAHAHLKSIAWHDGHALLLSLTPENAAQASDADAPQPDAPLLTAPAQAPAASDETLVIEIEELRSILETATDGVVILNDDGTIRSLNGSAGALFNYDDADLKAQPFAKLFAHESQRAVLDYLSGLADHGVASVLNDGREVIGREASGGFIPLFMTIGRLSGSNGYCAVMRDITQWKRTEEELRSAKRAAETANKHKTEFLARVSHEIRTPLNAIIGFSEMMAEERFGPIGGVRYLEYANDIGRSGKHVLDIVNDLLDISKIEAGEMEVEFTAVRLNDVLAQSVSLLQPQANGQRVIMRTSFSATVPEIVADERSVRQIALNLLSNAIRFTRPGGQVVVSTAYESDGSVALRIRDTGIGMTRIELEQALQPFRQVSASSRKRGDGTGLGLPLTKAMVEANRAQFEISSVPDEGTLVEITFPPQRVLAE